MKRTSLSEHKILETAAKAARPIIMRNLKGKKEGVAYRTKSESFIISTIYEVTNILECIDQLHFSVDLLSGYNSKSSPKKMDRHDHIRYGVENFYLRVTSIYDRCLRLVNNLYDLGLPERECKESTVTKNSHIKGTKLATALKDLNKFTQDFRSTRNTIAHSSAYEDEDLKELSSLYFLKDTPEFSQHKVLIKSMTNSYVKKKKTELFLYVGDLEGIVSRVLDIINNKLESEIRKNLYNEAL